MKWNNLGKIFDPREHAINGKIYEYAQSPQALVLKDRVRIFYSTRERDDTGKYLSHVSYVDFSLDFKSILHIADDFVIKLGELGCFDEHGIFPFNVLKDEDKVVAYTTGWNRKISVSADASIGMAVSHDDGKNFEKYGTGPLLTASLNEPFMVADAFVRKFEGKYYMWYIYGTEWKHFVDGEPADRIYKIAQATSYDGVNWSRDGSKIVKDKLNEFECQALPTVIYMNSAYHMCFCYREAYGFRHEIGRGYRLGYAHSQNLITWERDDSALGLERSCDNWDDAMQCYPHLFQVKDKIYMLYNGNEFGRYGFGLAELICSY